MALDNFAPLIGRWSISGEAEGTTSYRFAEGKRFLFQDFDIRMGTHRHIGLEVIGHLHPFGGQPTPEIWSRAYTFNSGMTLDYVYEMEGLLLTIWGGHKGSPNRMRGVFRADGQGFEASWEWPGGGYSVIGKRLE